jgi:hypothetical protein
MFGCLIKTIDEWLEITKKEAINFGLYPENYIQFMEIVKMIKKVRD